MLDYQTAKDLCAEIKAKMAEDPKFKEDTLWDDFVVYSIRYVRYIAEKHLRDKTEFDKLSKKCEDGLDQEFLNKMTESTTTSVQNVVCAQLVLIGRLLNIASIKELLPNEKSKLEFAWYVAMFELIK